MGVKAELRNSLASPFLAIIFWASAELLDVLFFLVASSHFENRQKSK